MYENSKVVDAAASPVQVKLGLNVLGDHRQALVILKRAPDLVGKLFTSCLLAFHLYLSNRLAQNIGSLTTGKKDNKEQHVDIWIFHPCLFSRKNWQRILSSSDSLPWLRSWQRVVRQKYPLKKPLPLLWKSHVVSSCWHIFPLNHISLDTQNLTARKATPTSMEIPHGSMAKYISTNDAKSQNQFGSPTKGPFCIMAENIKWCGMLWENLLCRNVCPTNVQHWQ